MIDLKIQYGLAKFVTRCFIANQKIFKKYQSKFIKIAMSKMIKNMVEKQDSNIATQRSYLFF